jgi:ribosomal protein S18 acetylase RimI-like enzyme
MPRVALYKPWTANMDEGWTRWLLEQYEFPYTSVSDSAVKAGNLRARFDVVVLPDMSLRDARDGMRADQVPPEYAGGLGAAGLAELKRFVETGGTVVTLDHAAEVATAALGVNVTRVTVPTRRDDEEQPTADSSAARLAAAAARRTPLYAPGSIFRVLVDARHPVAAGMPDSAAVYFTNSTTFDVPAGSPARVIARYPAAADDILLSGYLQGGEAIAGKAAAVEVPVGRGRVVMFGFRPQYRGQSYGTFRLLFNSLLTSVQ